MSGCQCLLIVCVCVCDIIIVITCAATGLIIVRETDGVNINCVVCRSSCH